MTRTFPRPAPALRTLVLMAAAALAGCTALPPVPGPERLPASSGTAWPERPAAMPVDGAPRGASAAPATSATPVPDAPVSTADGPAPGPAASAANEAPTSPDASAATPMQTGLASWYGRRFHGRRTASGERFDMRAHTAAHPALPFGSLVEVRNPANGRAVTVRINDRGPHIRGRIIDLSLAAARALGMGDVQQVELHPLHVPGR